MVKFKSHTKVVVVGDYEDGNGYCYGVKKAVEDGKDLYVEADGSEIPKIVDVNGKQIGYARERVLQAVLEEHPLDKVLEYVKEQVLHYKEWPPEYLSYNDGLRDAYGTILQRAGYEVREIPPPPPSKPSYEIVKISN